MVDVIMALAGDDKFRLASFERAEKLREILQQDRIDIEIDDFVERQCQS
ncbi:hypothetical protein [Methylovirgula sp. HY1]